MAEATKQEKLNEAKSVGEFFKFYLLPLTMLFASIFILIFIILPFAQGTRETLTNIGVTKEEYQRLEALKKKREVLQTETNQQEADLAKIDKLIPQSQTQVVDFSEKIRKASEANSLQLKESLVGEEVTGTQAQTVVETSEDVKGLELVELPAKFTLTGRFDNIQKFLRSIFGGDDFIIIKNMELRKQFGTNVDPNGQKETFSRENTNEWWMSLTLVKYQFRVGAGTTADDLRAAYFLVPETARADQQVLDFINENYK